jgi:transketolase
MAEMKPTRDAYGEVLPQLGAEFPNLVVCDADVIGSVRTGGFKKAFPERFFEFGIAEANMIGAAAGLAATGHIAVASTFAVFATGRVYDQIRQSVCLSNLNVKIIATHAGLTVGEDGASHQILEDIALMRVLPRMRVLVPSDYPEAMAAVRLAISSDGPCYVRLGREKSAVIYGADHKLEFGKAHRHGEAGDLAIVACGYGVPLALEAAESLRKDGLKVEVINCASVKPLDEAAIINAAHQAKRGVMVVEEHQLNGGLGEAVARVLGQHQPTRMAFFAVHDEFGQSGPAQQVLEHYGYTPAKVAQAARKFVG